MFFILFALLAAGLVFGLDAVRDLSGSRLLWTIGYIFSEIVLLILSGWSRSIVFDGRAGEITAVKTFFGIVLSRELTTTLESVNRLVLQEVELVKDRDMPFRRIERVGGILEVRSRLYRLFLDYGDGRLKLEEGNYREELEGMGIAIAQFLGAELRHESL